MDKQKRIAPEHILIAILSQEDSYAIKILAGILKLNVYEMRSRAIGMIATPQNLPEQNNFDMEGFVQVGNMKKKDSTLEYIKSGKGLPPLNTKCHQGVTLEN